MAVRSLERRAFERDAGLARFLYHYAPGCIYLDLCSRALSFLFGPDKCR
jgi:hypothetical protein